MDSQPLQGKRWQPYERFFEGPPDTSHTRRSGERVCWDEQVNTLEKEHDVDYRQPWTFGKWLESCHIDLSECGIRWPLAKLNELRDLRTRPKETHDQCIAWHIFRDNRAANLPSFETFVPTLDFVSCRDAWFLEKPIKLKEDHFTEFKVQLTEEKVSKIRILNVPVTEITVEMTLKEQHSAVVRDAVQRFYKVADEHPIEIHDATTNITPRGTATEIHHDSDPHISTACGRSGASNSQPMKLWILWNASENHRLSTCYSETPKALMNMDPCEYLIQFSGESLMLPANVPHAALSLSSHLLYSQTFHVQGRARDPTTFGLELSARAKPAEAVHTVLTCYEEGLQDPDPRIRTIHINHLIRTMSAECIVMRQVYRWTFVRKVLEVLRENRKFKGVCGMCQHFGLIPGHNKDCWNIHSLAMEQLLTAGRRRNAKGKRPP